MDAGEVDLIRKTFESALPGMTGDPVPVLADLGWPELHAAEPAVAVGELFEAQGRTGATTAALDVVVALALGSPLPERTAVVHPAPPAFGQPPGDGIVAGGLRFEGLVLAGGARADRFLVPAGGDGDPVTAVAISCDQVSVRPVAGLDPTLGLLLVSGAVSPSTITAELARGSVAGAAPAGPAWDVVAGAARRALAHEQCGLAQAVLDAAVTHVTDRHQFGKPIAAFQTVRHRLTEVFVALTSARAALEAAWATGDPLLDDAAKALAGRAGALAARHCLQVTGAIGFTEEYPLAARIRRLAMLDALYGSADELESAIGTQLLAAGRLPRPYPLT